METTPQEYQAAIAAQLDEQRRVKDYTFDELATRTNVARASITRYLKNQRDIPFRALVELCEALDISVPELIRRAEKRLSDKS